MEIAELIVALQSAKAPDRRLDVEIATILGYRKPADKWLKPDGSIGKVYAYTRVIDNAMEMADFAAPEHVGGCSWEKSKGAAKINDGPYAYAANPAIALCVAALQILWRKQRGEDDATSGHDPD